MHHSATILLVEDDEANRGVFHLCLASAGYEVVMAEDGLVAMKLLNQQQFDVVLTDMLMPNADGVELLTHLRKLPVRPVVITMCGGGQHIGANQLLNISQKLGAFAALQKPFTRDQLLAVIENALASVPPKTVPAPGP
jgi:CheY-like chemotaxis protein